jgi:very-short-patch-repair endonuclease
MIRCHVCKEQFANNLGGQLTNHLEAAHSLSYKDWIIATQYNGITPRCICGMCDCEPEFYRKDFRKYASRHNSFEWRNKRYVELYGQPKCKTCNKEVGFAREKPLKYCSFVCQGLNIGNRPEERLRRSIQQKELMADQEHLDKLMATGGMRGRLSKLHIKVREKMELEEKGFKSEQVIGYYCVDELNEETKTVIEINGDYVHANPKFYDENDIITLQGTKYTAKEKWEIDARKHQYLKNKGYKVTVIWESDVK